VFVLRLCKVVKIKAFDTSAPQNAWWWSAAMRAWHIKCYTQPGGILQNPKFLSDGRGSQGGVVRASSTPQRQHCVN
jgi:hypothetical protein